MRGKKAKAIRKKLLRAGVSISSDLMMTSTGARASKGRKMYQLIKRGLAVLDE